MKKFLSFLAFALLAVSLFAAPSFGYNIAPMGEMSGDKSFAGLEATAVFSFTGDHHVGDVSVDAVFGLGDPLFKGVNATLSTSLFWVESDYLFPNVVLWEPKVSVGYQYRLDGGNRLMVGLSPLHFADKGYTYEFLSPYMTVDADKTIGWGFRIMKFTAYIGG